MVKVTLSSISRTKFGTETSFVFRSLVGNIYYRKMLSHRLISSAFRRNHTIPVSFLNISKIAIAFGNFISNVNILEPLNPLYLNFCKYLNLEHNLFFAKIRRFLFSSKSSLKVKPSSIVSLFKRSLINSTETGGIIVPKERRRTICLLC